MKEAVGLLARQILVLQSFFLSPEIYILLCVWVELAVLGSTKTALKFKYEI